MTSDIRIIWNIFLIYSPPTPSPLHFIAFLAFIFFYFLKKCRPRPTWPTWPKGSYATGRGPTFYRGGGRRGNRLFPIPISLQCFCESAFLAFLTIYILSFISFSKLTLRPEYKFDKFALMTSVWPGDTSDSRNSSVFFLILLFQAVYTIHVQINLNKI